MPYAAKATIEHEYSTDHLHIWLTFRYPMKRSSDILADPPVYDIKPPVSLWSVDCDGTAKTISSSAWQDEYTLLLTSQTLTARPARVLLSYNGPNAGLRTAWDKEYEPWGPILSTDLTATLLPTGLILLWSGSTSSIPSGWALCDGSNGTPDLRNRFIVGAGSTYAVGATGGALTHRHTVNYGGVGGLLEGTNIIDDDPNGVYGTGVGYGGQATSEYTDHKPPYYALAYIMKL